MIRYSRWDNDLVGLLDEDKVASMRTDFRACQFSLLSEPMSIKRHPALQPFSRDHLIGLFHAQRLIKLEINNTDHALSETIAAFEQAWKREISVHFADEDRLLGPLPISPESLKRLHEEHIELTGIIEQVFIEPFSASLAAQVGNLLDAHIRWEEHELFPEIGSSLSETELTGLGEQTAIMELSRDRKL